MFPAASSSDLIGIGLPSVAVWLLRRDQPDMMRPYRAPRGTITLGLLAAVVWGISTILGFQQFGLPTVIFGLILAYSGAALYAFRKWSDRRKAGIRGASHSLHVKLTGAMLLVLVLDGVGYYMAVHSVMLVTGHQTALIAALEDIFVAVAMLTITVGLVLPGMIAHSVDEVAGAADRLATGTMADFSRAMGALAAGDLDRAMARVDLVPVVATSRDEVGAMARSFNTLQQEIARAAEGLAGAREGLRAARRELTEINASLETRVMDRTTELESVHRKLVMAARHAGMAEVAIGVLHNIGNVLTSVNVSASLVDRRLRDSKVEGLQRVVELLAAHGADFGRFILEDEKGKLLPEYLTTLSVHLQSERKDALTELESVTKGIDHIKQIVSSQQSMARGASLVEDVDPLKVMEDALQINMPSLSRHGVTVERSYDTTLASFVADRHQILQILVNLISNAVRALKESEAPQKTIVVTVGCGADQDHILWRVQDGGVGIPHENLHRIFEYGFTTKADGHGGFGLHTAALAASLMSGSLKVQSDGSGAGATFTLELPILAATIEAQVLAAQ
jgi:signal transduction histidine kinase